MTKIIVAVPFTITIKGTAIVPAADLSAAYDFVTDNLDLEGRLQNSLEDDPLNMIVIGEANPHRPSGYDSALTEDIDMGEPVQVTKSDAAQTFGIDADDLADDEPKPPEDPSGDYRSVDAKE